MEFTPSMVRGRFLARRKRFFADAVLDDGREVVAHCPNPGSMLSLLHPGEAVWLARAAAGLKLAWRWRLARMPSGALVGVDTLVPNRLLGEAFAARTIASLADLRLEKAEASLPAGVCDEAGPATRLDFLLRAADGAPVWVEVKNVTLSRRLGLAEFPDSRTQRGSRHLRALRALAASGVRAIALYLIQRDDCEAMALADDIDPVYAHEMALAQAAGVEVVCLTCALSPQEVRLNPSPAPFIARAA